MTVLPRRLPRRLPSLRAFLTVLVTALSTNVGLVEAGVRLLGVAVLAIALGSLDWRLGAAFVGIALILSTIELPRRTR